MAGERGPIGSTGGRGDQGPIGPEVNFVLINGDVMRERHIKCFHINKCID